MDNFMNEPFDLRRFMILLIRKIWVVLTSIIVGAAIFGLMYYAKQVWLAGPQQYQSKVMYEIAFDQEQVENIHDYYNDYTWNEVLDSDAIAGRAAEIAGAFLDGITKEEIAEVTTIPTMSDIRFIWVEVEMDSAEKADIIQDAIGQALAEFAEKTDGFTSITVFDRENTDAMPRGNHLGRWLIFGGAMGAIIAFFFLLYHNAIDDSLYIEADVQKRFGFLCAGVLDRQIVQEQAGDVTGKAEYLELKANLQELTKGRENVVFADGYEGATPETLTEDILKQLVCQEGEKPVKVSKASYYLGKEREYFVKVKNADCVIWMLPFGKMNGTRLDRAWKNLQFWSCNVDTAILVDVDMKYYRAYYRISKDIEEK